MSLLWTKSCYCNICKCCVDCCGLGACCNWVACSCSVADSPVPLGYRLGGSDDMERRAELFSQVCRQKMMMAADDEELDDQELTFQTAASSHSRPAQR